MNDFMEKTFLITGASSGIGAGLARRFNALGAEIIACGRDRGRLEELRASAASPEKIHLEPFDLAVDLQALPNWVKSLRQTYGPLHGLIHSAGITATEPLRMVRAEKLNEMFAINCFAALMLAQGFTSRGVAAEKGASIIFIASTAAVRPVKGLAVYSASKAALAAAAKSLSCELAPRGVRVNVISPELIDTPMAAAFLRSAGGEFEPDRHFPLGLGRVEDVAALAAFLASDAARWITGQNYILDGGRHGGAESL